MGGGLNQKCNMWATVADMSVWAAVLKLWGKLKGNKNMDKKPPTDTTCWFVRCVSLKWRRAWSDRELFTWEIWLYRGGETARQGGKIRDLKWERGKVTLWRQAWHIWTEADLPLSLRPCCRRIRDARPDLKLVFLMLESLNTTEPYFALKRCQS